LGGGGGGDTQLLDFSPHEHPIGNNPGDQFLAHMNDSMHVVLGVGETFYDPDNEIVITTINITNQSAEIYLGLMNCGDGLIEIGEECDVGNLDSQTCDSIGYRGGDLSCTLSCKFDTSQCGEPICGEGHTYNGGDSCSVIFKADREDGPIIAYGFFTDWDVLRNSEVGSVRGSSATYSFKLLSGSTRPSISRISIPFDTSSIPNQALINSAELTLDIDRLYDLTYINTHPNSDDFVTLVPTTLDNPPNLSINDFNEFSFVDSPIELSDRIDLSDELDFDYPGWYFGRLSFTLNSQGLENINKNGYSGFGLRGGYDLFTTPNNGEYTELNLLLEAVEYLSNEPKLIINYTVPCSYAPIDECMLCPDLNSDSLVNLTDRDLLFNCFHVGDCPMDYDLNGDGEITFNDLLCLTPFLNMTASRLSTCCSNCGNDIVDTPIEQCDGTDFYNAGEDCTDYGYFGGELSCSSSCQLSFGSCVECFVDSDCAPSQYGGCCNVPNGECRYNTKFTAVSCN